MRNIESKHQAGVNEHAHKAGILEPVAPITEKEKEDQVEVEKWAWEIHEVALHEAAQSTALPAIGVKEPLLKKVSDEVSRLAQARLRRARQKGSS